MRPSCGSRFSAMLRPDITLIREVIADCTNLGGLMTSYIMPSTRKRTTNRIRTARYEYRSRGP